MPCNLRSSGRAIDASTIAQEPPPTSIHQFRIYEIFNHNKAAFHDRSGDHAARTMAKSDFQIVAMWEAKTSERTAQTGWWERSKIAC